MVAVDSGLDGVNPQITLTCISTGGPATTVTWTRDSTTVTEGSETVLDDPVAAQYTHTLTVTTGGEYTCTVSNTSHHLLQLVLIQVYLTLIISTGCPYDVFL